MSAVWQFILPPITSIDCLTHKLKSIRSLFIGDNCRLFYHTSIGRQFFFGFDDCFRFQWKHSSDELIVRYCWDYVPSSPLASMSKCGTSCKTMTALFSRRPRHVHPCFITVHSIGIWMSELNCMFYSIFKQRKLGHVEQQPTERNQRQSLKMIIALKFRSRYAFFLLSLSLSITLFVCLPRKMFSESKATTEKNVWDLNVMVDCDFSFWTETMPMGVLASNANAFAEMLIRSRFGSNQPFVEFVKKFLPEKIHPKNPFESNSLAFELQNSNPSVPHHWPIIVFLVQETHNSSMRNTLTIHSIKIDIKFTTRFSYPLRPLWRECHIDGMGFISGRFVVFVSNFMSLFVRTASCRW